MLELELSITDKAGKMHPYKLQRLQDGARRYFSGTRGF